MALLKIFTSADNYDFLHQKLSYAIKMVASAALNCNEIPTTPSDLEIVYNEGIDLAGIDFIIEIVGCERPNLQNISEQIIKGLNVIYPDKSFSVYFNIINKSGMANTSRSKNNDKPINMDEAIKLSRSKI